MSDKSKKIAELNDQFRTTFHGGRVLRTSGIAALDEATQADIFMKVQQFTAFTEDNDPHGEHDFGAFDHETQGKIFWKIDYYALDEQHGSDDPSDPEQTVRILTIMFAHEY